MKINPEITIKDFDVPDCVYEDRPLPAPAAPAPAVAGPYKGAAPVLPLRVYELSELSLGELNTLCERFRLEVLRKAGRNVNTAPQVPDLSEFVEHSRDKCYEDKDRNR